ncbi:hypothetical protein H5410_027306 [Solanum commersonii]|uniref:Uncharacterized protein n=1 Tax=Solanum commersonii TaxID=4109 RepID=A0A9J5Z429_SOLCO|nr:hypothetical protein H5410_027306 [Solanum commersonii]
MAKTWGPKLALATKDHPKSKNKPSKEEGCNQEEDKCRKGERIKIVRRLTRRDRNCKKFIMVDDARNEMGSSSKNLKQSFLPQCVKRGAEGKTSNQWDL